MSFSGEKVATDFLQVINGTILSAASKPVYQTVMLYFPMLHRENRMERHCTQISQELELVRLF